MTTIKNLTISTSYHSPQSINKLNNKYIVNAILTSIMLWLTILTQVLASIWSSGLSVYSSQQIFKSPFHQYRLVVNVTWFILNCRIIVFFYFAPFRSASPISDGKNNDIGINFDYIHIIKSLKQQQNNETVNIFWKIFFFILRY